MSTASRHPRRDANHIRIYAFASMTTVLHFLMKNFKRSGSPQYSSITAAALLCYSIALPLAHMAQLELVYTRASDMRVVQVAMNRPKHIIYALATIITASFVGPGIFSVYSLLGMGGSKSSLEFALWVLGWGTLALVVVDIAALFISFAMFATFSSYIQGRFRRTISLCLVFASTAMLGNTFLLTQTHTRSGSVQEFAEDILVTNPTLFIGFLISIIISRLANSSDKLPEDLPGTKSQTPLSSK